MHKPLLDGLYGFVPVAVVYTIFESVLLFKVSRKVKLEHQNSEQFYVVGPEDRGCKVAPGMSATFTVFFTPQEIKVNLYCKQ